MSINRAQFSFEWSVLEDRFQVPHNLVTGARYFEIMEEELTTEQFLLAANRAFRFETFFPSPQCLIDHALGDFQTRAEDVWDDIMTRLIGGHEVVTDAGTLERTILAKLGGGKALAEASDYGRRDMRNQFIRRYARALRAKTTPNVPAVKALPAAPSTPLPLPALGEARGKTIHFLQVLRDIGVPVEIPSKEDVD